MELITKKTVLVCQHEIGLVQTIASQNFVHIDGSSVLVERDPEGKAIVGCPIVGMGVFPCTLTFAAQQGYSDFIRIGGKRVAMNTVKGLTNGTPPGTVNYKVSLVNQSLVTTNK